MDCQARRGMQTLARYRLRAYNDCSTQVAQVRYRGMRVTMAVAEYSRRIIGNIEQVIIGKHAQVELLLVALLCQGHVLVEDVPGTGKTMLARAAAASLGLSFGRLQCTPDLLPNDITGVEIYNQKESRFEFQPGPVFVNILLADEINRATPRTQAALLEAMQEGQVTTAGDHAPLANPVLGSCHPEPHRVRGHLSPSRGPA